MGQHQLRHPDNLRDLAHRGVITTQTIPVAGLRAVDRFDSFCARQEARVRANLATHERRHHQRLQDMATRAEPSWTLEMRGLVQGSGRGSYYRRVRTDGEATE